MTDCRKLNEQFQLQTIDSNQIWDIRIKNLTTS